MRRTFGYETEYGAMVDMPYDRRQEFAECSDQISRQDWRDITNDVREFTTALFVNLGYRDLLPPNMRAARVFVENGARAYLDAGLHPEYSTPEAFSPLGLVVLDAAGVMFMRDVCSIIRERAPVMYGSGKNSWYEPDDDDIDEYSRQDRPVRLKQGLLLPYYMPRSTTNGDNTWGRHLNLSADPSLRIKEEALAPIMLALLGGVAMFGGGYVDKQGDFHVSQKYNVSTYISQHTIRTKPLVSDRSQSPYANTRSAQRLHIVSLSPQHSEYANYLQAGILELCLTLCERRPDLAAKLGKRLPQNVRQVTHDFDNITGTSITRMGDSKTANAVDVMEEVFQIVCEGLRDIDLMANGRAEILAEWETMLSALRNQDAMLTELFDVHRRHELYQFLRGRGASAARLYLHDTLSNDISGWASHKITDPLQEHLHENSWPRLAAQHNIDEARLRAVAEDYRSLPMGRALYRGTDISEAEGNNTITNWQKWEDKMSQQKVMDPDVGLTARLRYAYDPLARISAKAA